jgi:Fe2+ or Zn2+ uptake regulation protein
MGADQNESKRRRTVDGQKLSAKHPIAAIEKRVIDSDAFAALPPSAGIILLLLARNLDKGRNGHIFLPQESAQRHGIANKTLYRQLKVLTAAGFIFQTKRGGYGKCSLYALTWLPLSKDTKGLRIDNFKPCAWRDWTPNGKKKAQVKMSHSKGQIYRFIAHRVDKNTALEGDISTHIEFNTNTQWKRVWIPGYLAQLRRRRLSGHECFQVPSGVAPQ